jgi:hypothetical protein
MIIFSEAGGWMSWVSSVNWPGVAITATGIATTIGMGGMQLFRAWARLSVEIRAWERQAEEMPPEKLKDLFSEGNTK